MVNKLWLGLLFATLQVNATDEIVHHDPVKIGAWAKFKNATYNVAKMPVEATSWCVSKTCYYTKQAAFFVYKTADKMIYVVGLTTTGFLIYCYFNGKLETVVTVDADTSRYWGSLSGVPFFKELKVELPEFIVNFCLTKQEKITALENRMGNLIKGISQSIEELRNAAGQTAKSALVAPSASVKEVLQESAKRFSLEANNVEKALLDL